MMIWIRRRLAREDGISLVEMMIALFVVAFALMAMSATLISSFTAISRNESLVHGTAVANEVLEDLQALQWSSLGLDEDDEDLVENDQVLIELGEPLVFVTDEDASPPPHRRELADREGRAFTARTYVTWVPQGEGANQVAEAHKRMTVVVSWSERGAPRELQSDSIRSATPDEEAQEGLSLHIMHVRPTNHNDGKRTLEDVSLKDDECYPDDAGPDCGKLSEQITVTASATEPVGSVELRWRQRGDSEVEDSWTGKALMTYFPDRKLWTATLPTSRKFHNGPVEFVAEVVFPLQDEPVIAPSPQVLLHPLRIARFAQEDGSDFFCADENGTLSQGAEIRIDLVGADIGSLPVFWMTPVPEDPEAEVDADRNVEREVKTWGLAYVLELSVGDQIVDKAARPSTVRFELGPIVELDIKHADFNVFYSDLTYQGGSPC